MIDIQTIDKTDEGYEIVAYLEYATQTRWSPHAPQEYIGGTCICTISDLLLDGEPFPSDPDEQQDILTNAEWSPLDAPW